MNNKFLVINVLSWLCLPVVCIESVSAEDVSWRFHAQWRIDEATRARLDAVYGSKRVDFDKNGYPTPHGLSPLEMKRWMRLYLLCMSDGCTYCDPPTEEDGGSCESGTCGLENAYCKPYVGENGQSLCGQECADYAFTSMLPCNDPSERAEP